VIDYPNLPSLIAPLSLRDNDLGESFLYHIISATCEIRYLIWVILYILSIYLPHVLCIPALHMRSVSRSHGLYQVHQEHRGHYVIVF